MASIALDIEDDGTALLLRTLLRAAGHEVGGASVDLLLTDNPRRAVAIVAHTPSLILTPMAGVPDAVRAMEQGVYGYILLPLQPGEAQVMVARALSQPGARTDRGEDCLLPLEQVEREHILRVLRACRQNQAKAARILGIGRNTLWRKLRRYGLAEPDGV